MITDIRDMTSFKWATVTGTNPVQIKLDGDSLPLALIPDSLVDPASLGVGERVRVELSLRKVVIHGAANGGALTGEVRMTATPNAPIGWLLCRGQSLLRTQFQNLYNAIGTTYGSTSNLYFNIPDLRGRTAVGRDPVQTEFNTMGKSGGAKTHRLTNGQMPKHSHGIYGPGVSSPALIPSQNIDGPVSNNRSYVAQAPNPLRTYDEGNNEEHNNLQPYMTLDYMIKI